MKPDGMVGPDRVTDAAAHALAIRDFIATIDDDELQAVAAYWNEKRSGRLMPLRCEIDPLQLPSSLWSRIILVDVQHAGAGKPRRFRWRRVGGWWCALYQSEPTGKWLDEMFDSPTRDAVQSSYDWAVDRRFPLRVMRRDVFERAVLVFEAVVLPLGVESTDRTDMILIVGAPIPETPVPSDSAML